MHKFLIIFTLSIAGLIDHNVSFANPDCTTPGSDRMTCLNMRHLRSHLDLFDSQRDLLQINYSFLEQIAGSMNSIVNGLLTDPNRATHLAPLGEVRNLTSDVITLSRKQDIDTLKKTNLIRQKCQQCHAAVSGDQWSNLGRDFSTGLGKHH